jgi:hypothetical protein
MASPSDDPTTNGPEGFRHSLTGVSGLRGVVLTVRFLCELGMLIGLVYWGFTVGDGAAAWVLGIGAPAIVALIWGTFIAPKATRPLSIPFRVSIEIDLFVLTAVALWFADARPAAIALGVLGVTTSLLNVVTAA